MHGLGVNALDNGVNALDCQAGGPGFIPGRSVGWYIRGIHFPSPTSEGRKAIYAECSARGNEAWLYATKGVEIVKE